MSLGELRAHLQSPSVGSCWLCGCWAARLSCRPPHLSCTSHGTGLTNRQQFDQGGTTALVHYFCSLLLANLFPHPAGLSLVPLYPLRLLTYLPTKPAALIQRDHRPQSCLTQPALRPRRSPGALTESLPGRSGHDLCRCPPLGEGFPPHTACPSPARSLPHPALRSALPTPPGPRSTTAFPQRNRGVQVQRPYSKAWIRAAWKPRDGRGAEAVRRGPSAQRSPKARGAAAPSRLLSRPPPCPRRGAPPAGRTRRRSCGKGPRGPRLPSRLPRGQNARGARTRQAPLPPSARTAP